MSEPELRPLDFGGADLHALAGAFHDSDLPLAARLDAARILLGVLTRAVAVQRGLVAALVEQTPLDDDTLATLYWDFEDLIPTKLLGPFHAIREIVEARCPWTYPCPRCGQEQPITSRSALRSRQRAPESESPARTQGSQRADMCRSCRNADVDAQHASFAAWEERRRMRVRELRVMPYKDYLLTPEWQERRKARLKAARYRCQVCNAGNRVLNVHHRTYKRRGDEEPRDLIVLCEECHHLFHRNGSLAPHGDND